MVGFNPRGIHAIRNRNAIEEIFIKATRIQSLAMGIVYFMTKELEASARGEDEMSKLIRWASEVAKDTLQSGVGADL
jgi:nucleolar MIF4G domain-containing protein 1